MADIQDIKDRVSEIAGRRNNVTLSDIEWVVNQLGKHGFTVDSSDAKHGRIFQVESQTFMVNHHTGGKQIKNYSVKDFLKAMSELDLYE